MSPRLIIVFKEQTKQDGKAKAKNSSNAQMRDSEFTKCW